PTDSFKGEYNITETARFQYHFCRKAKISLQTFSLQYHFTCREKYSLFVAPSERKVPQLYSPDGE
ncbi:MAG: hypothetical protein II366_03755, partial [Clostridia bacterium]|nr:hypothetical protein [Clostridia bacterium]